MLCVSKGPGLLSLVLFILLNSLIFLSTSVLFHVPIAWRMRGNNIYALISK